MFLDYMEPIRNVPEHLPSDVTVRFGPVFAYAMPKAFWNDIRWPALKKYEVCGPQI
jgi:hypothetical protein